MIPTNFIFGPSLLKKVLKLNRNLQLEIGSCQHICVQMKFSIPGTTGKSSLKKIPVQTKFTLIMDSCSFQDNAPFVKYVNLAQ